LTFSGGQDYKLDSNLQKNDISILRKTIIEPGFAQIGMIRARK